LASGDFLFRPHRACPSGYKLNFRICLEIHLLNYFAQQTTHTAAHRNSEGPGPKRNWQGIFLFANMKNELHLTAAGSG